MSMLAVYCWNISRENSLGQGGKYTLKKKLPVHDQVVIGGNSLQRCIYLYISLQSQSLPGTGMSGQKNRAFVNLWLIDILAMELQSYFNERIVSADYFHESNFLSLSGIIWGLLYIFAKQIGLGFHLL